MRLLISPTAATDEASPEIRKYSMVQAAVVAADKTA